MKASSVNEYLNILRAILRLSIDWEYLDESPARKVKPMRVQKVEPPSLSVAEADRLVDACTGDPNLHIFSMAGLDTGFRIGEIINLTWPDTDFKRGILKVRPKKSRFSSTRDAPPCLLTWFFRNHTFRNPTCKKRSKV